MRRPILILIFALVLLCGLLLFAWTEFMTAVNSRQSLVTIHISASVDEVTIFSVGDTVNPLYTIATHGEDTVRGVNLLAARGSSSFVQMPPAQYYFVAQKGDQQYQSTPFCCQTGFLPGQITLNIVSLDEWSVSGQ